MKTPTAAASRDEEDRRKRSVTFGKSTTYEVEAGEDESGQFQTKDVRDGKGSPRPSGDNPKVIAEKDLSDGRSEKEKIRELLEKKEREQLEEIQEMNRWNSKQEETKRPSQVEESYGDSSTSNAPIAVVARKQDQSSGSYDTDEFEEMSASGSGSKQKPFQSKKPEATYDPKAMEEYMKKQQQNKSSPPKQPLVREQSESSDRYDEDFESASRSQLNSGMLLSPKGIPLT